MRDEKGMKVRVRAYMPGFEGRGEVQVEFKGHELKDLIFQLFSDIDPEKKRMIFDDRGEISSDLTVILNGKIVSGSNRFTSQLRGGDFVELVLAG